MRLHNYWVLEYSFKENVFIAIPFLEQIKANTTCLLEGIPHDYATIRHFDSKERLEEEVEYLMKKLETKPDYLPIRLYSNSKN